MVETKEGIKKLYSIGYDEVNYHHLGISALESEDKTIFIREISAFDGFKIIDFTAGHRTSHVIIEGEKDAVDNLHTH
jgi:hypothetical protein